MHRLGKSADLHGSRGFESRPLRQTHQKQGDDMTLTFDTVIEEHRLKVGADRVHVTLGPDATPEGLAAEMERVRLDGELIDAFSEVEMERARTARLKRDITALARKATEALQGSEEDRVRALRDVSIADDMFTDTDMVEDLVWMVLDRKARKERLPEGAQERADALIAKDPRLARIRSPFRLA